MKTTNRKGKQPQTRGSKSRITRKEIRKTIKDNPDFWALEIFGKALKLASKPE